jgi:hypothetical protein
MTSPSHGGGQEFESPRAHPIFIDEFFQFGKPCFEFGQASVDVNILAVRFVLPACSVTIPDRHQRSFDSAMKIDASASPGIQDVDIPALIKSL